MANGRLVGGPGGEDDYGDKPRWIEAHNKLSAPKHPSKSLNPHDIPHRPPEHITASSQLQRFRTVASDDSSCPNPPANGGSPLPPGYVRFDSKVRINLNTRSKLEIRELKRKLLTELEQVRNLRRKLDTRHLSQCTNTAGANRVVGTLSRVNSEVSCVGPTSQSLDNRNHSHNYVNAPKLGDKVKKTPTANPPNKNAESNKRLKPGGSSGGAGGGKRAGGGGGGGGVEALGFTKELVRKCRDVLGKLMKHPYGWVFNTPVDVKKLKLHDYYAIIKHPMDLGTVKNRLSKNWYKSPEEFAEDVRLTFNNAMTYNAKGQDAHVMAETLLKIFEDNWAAIMSKINLDQRLERAQNASLPTSASRRDQAPLISAPAHAGRTASAPAPTPTKLQTPLETRTLDVLESRSMPVNSNLKAPNNQGNAPSKKPKEKSPEKRDMTFEEKQRLSTNMQSLPSAELDIVVKIIKKRNPGLVQEEDEIEVDIDSFDNETLWELDQFISNYKNNLSKNKRNTEYAVQGMEEADEETNLLSATSRMPKEAAAVETIAPASRVPGKRLGDEGSRSNSSGSSSSDSGSSSSESGSDSSSGYGSDAGQ